MTSALRYSLVVAVGLFVVVGSMFAQASGEIENSGGKTYVVAFPDTTTNKFDTRYPNNRLSDKAFLFIYSAVDNFVTITGRGYSRDSVAVAAGRFAIIDLMAYDNPAPVPIVSESCKPANNTFRIEAVSPVVVYQYFATRFGAEAWTPLPVEAWGTEYYAAAFPGEIGSDVYPGTQFDFYTKNRAFPAEILVVAAFNDTKITIVPNGQVQNFCNPTSITLKAGEAYQIQSWVDTLSANEGADQPDFGGSRIFSTKPVGVISGNTRARLDSDVVGLGMNVFKNMLIEWLAPVEQHGTEFVYMPTWDNRRPTGAPGEDTLGKRHFEAVRTFATHEGPTQGVFIENGSVVQYDDSIAQGGHHEMRHLPDVARVHKTTLPAQVMMGSPGVAKYAGTTDGYGGYTGAAYDGWGGYMVELTPREQWTSFAPFYAPMHPSGMEHFVNVVTDTAHANDVYLKNGARFVFQHRIAGTDLVWGPMGVVSGVDNWLEGRSGARFAGFVYGTLAAGGHEEYRPGRVRDDDRDPPTGINLDGGDATTSAASSTAYEEYLGMAYAYPLAASHVVPARGDSLEIDLVNDCGLWVYVEAWNDNPVGLRSIRLDSAINAKIVSQSPFPISGAINAYIYVNAIDRHKDASAIIVIKDKTGKITRVRYSYRGEDLAFDPAMLDFGTQAPGSTVTRTLEVTNRSDRALALHRIQLIDGDSAFAITSAPPMPLTIPANGSITLTVTANPPNLNSTFRDTIEIGLNCTNWKIPVTLSTAGPCISMNDLDFGALIPGESRTRPLSICNSGGGEVTFVGQSGGEVIEWLVENFYIYPSEMALLKSARLNSGECITINVTFTALDTGSYKTTARVFASTRNCRDTSVWTAVVDRNAAAPAELEASNMLGAGRPNPFTHATDIEYTIARAGHVTLVVYDSRGEQVATLVEGTVESGAHVARFDAALLPAGVYHCRLSVGDFSQTRIIVKE